MLSFFFGVEMLFMRIFSHIQYLANKAKKKSYMINIKMQSLIFTMLVKQFYV